jgi:CubicO group peptidase (beta-lactamase class C family)
MEALQAVLDEAVAVGDAAGVAAAVVGPGGTGWTGFAGATAVGGEQRVGPETVFWIASMTKAITSVAAMQLVEQGKMSLDMEMGQVLPELEHPLVLHAGSVRPAEKKITLRHLMTHTAGFGYPWLSQELTDFIAARPPESLPPPGTRAALNAPLLFEPGERLQYGISTDWLGLAVEAAAGVTLDKYFSEHIFAPLGMTETTFTPSEAQRARQAMLHERGEDGKLAAKRLAKPFAEHFCAGGGGLFSTLGDYAKFLRIFCAGGAGIISAGTILAMRSNQIGELFAGPILPNANREIKGKWGLGFFINLELGPFGRPAGAYGWSGMANTYFWIDPEINLAGVIMMQNLPPGDAGCIRTYNRFEQSVYAALQ